MFTHKTLNDGKAEEKYLFPAIVVVKADFQPLLAGLPAATAKSWIKADCAGDAEWAASGSSSTTASGWRKSTYGKSGTWLYERGKR